MKWSRPVLGLIFLFIATWTAGGLLDVPFFDNLALMSIICVTVILLYYYLKFEENKGDARTIAILGTLAAISIAGRVIFAPVPSVQPSTFIIIITGYVFGPIPGFMVGATTALVSNFMLGHGPWTVWQMLAWGLAGFSAGLLCRYRLPVNRWGLSLFCAAWGFIYGWIMNVYFLIGFIRPLSFQAFLTTYTMSLWFDAVHAAGNFAFAFFLGPSMITMLSRYKARFTFSLSEDIEPGYDKLLKELACPIKPGEGMKKL